MIGKYSSFSSICLLCIVHKCAHQFLTSMCIERGNTFECQVLKWLLCGFWNQQSKWPRKCCNSFSILSQPMIFAFGSWNYSKMRKTFHLPGIDVDINTFRRKEALSDDESNICFPSNQMRCDKRHFHVLSTFDSNRATPATECHFSEAAAGAHAQSHHIKSTVDTSPATASWSPLHKCTCVSL